MQKKRGFNPKQYERPGLIEDEIIEIKEAFDLFDTEGNGYVDARVKITISRNWK
jgi:Ca2+-binding EF-hand superfamily protein